MGDYNQRWQIVRFAEYVRFFGQRRTQQAIYHLNLYRYRVPMEPPMAFWVFFVSFCRWRKCRRPWCRQTGCSSRPRQSPQRVSLAPGYRKVQQRDRKLELPLDYEGPVAVDIRELPVPGGREGRQSFCSRDKLGCSLVMKKRFFLCLEYFWKKI